MIYETAEDIKKARLKVISNPVMHQKPVKTDSETGISSSMSYGERGYIKRFIPYFIYRPPFGYPRRDIDIINVRKLAQSPFVFSVIKTLLDEVSALKWDIVPVEGVDEETVKNKKKEIFDFLYNPNDNDESFRDVIRQVIKDVLEIDAGVIEKVYNRKGELTQLFAVDGSTILLNPDEHGYMGNRIDYVAPIDPSIVTQDQIKNYYTYVLTEEAAYFQYNWTGGIWPVPFGKKELIYIKSNTRSDSIYGTSPIMVLYSILLTLIYGAQTNLDMYISNDLPNGIISIINANKEQIQATREYFNQKIIMMDEFGNNRKKYFNIPITSTDVKYTPFNLNAKDMQMLEQQKWYQEIVLMGFGVSPSEMGISPETRSNANEQSRIFKRKALRPILQLIEYNLTTKIVWELDPDRELQLKYDDYDIEQDFRKAELNEKLKHTWTINEIREKDNMPKLDGEEYDQIQGNTPIGHFGDSFGIADFTGQDRVNNQANKEDLQNEERNPEKEDKSHEKPEDLGMKSISQLPKITKSEYLLKKMYDNLEQAILRALD